MLIVAGLPASGKSTFARRHGGRVLEFDDIAERFGAYSGIEGAKALAGRQFALLAGSGVYDTVVDVFQSKESRARILKTCPKACIAVVHAPLEACLRRNARRRHGRLDAGELVSIAMQFEPVRMAEGFSSIIHFDNSKEFPMEEGTIWLKAVDGEVQAFGDEESLIAVTGGRYDVTLSVEEWERHGCVARLEGGRIVLGDPAEVAYQRNAEIIRNERRNRLHHADRVGGVWWDAMSEAQREAWRNYRQALLDIPQQPGFPWDGDPDKAPWPVNPE